MKRRTNRIGTLIRHACLVMGLMALTACSGDGDLAGPDPAETVLGTGDAAQKCPSFEEACAELGKAVYDACPLSKLPDPGDLALCKFYAFTSAYKKLSTCFTDAERLELYECAKEWMPYGERPKPPPEPESEPTRTSKPLREAGEMPRPLSESAVYIGAP